METKLLEKIGLNKSEAKVYLSLLDIGSSTTGPIMHRAKVSSSKIYGILARLVEKGLVSSVIKSKTKYYQASPPESLLDYMKEKEEELKKNETQLNKLIPELKLRQSTVEEKQEAQLYIGWKGLMNALNSLLGSLSNGDDYIAFAQTPKEEESKEVKIFFSQLQKRREEKKLNVKIMADSAQKRIFDSEPYSKFKNFQVKYMKNSPPGIVIAKDQIFISTFEPSPVGVVISSKELAYSFRKYFYGEWKKN